MRGAHVCDAAGSIQDPSPKTSYQDASPRKARLAASTKAERADLDCSGAWTLGQSHMRRPVTCPMRVGRIL